MSTSSQQFQQQVSTSSMQSFSLISLLQKQLENVLVEHIQLFCRKIYPVELSAPNTFNYLYRTLINYFTIQGNKGISYENIVGDVGRVAAGVNELLAGKLGKILAREEFKRRINQNVNKKIQNNNSFVSKNSKPSAYSSTLLQSLGSKYGSAKQTGFPKYNQQLLNKELNETYKKDNSITIGDNLASIAQRYFKEKNSVENLMYRVKMQAQLRQFGEIAKKKCLICENSLGMGNTELKKMFFKCQDCGELYHKKCMPRDNNCSLCQLANIHPLQKSKSQYFLGILKKGTKRHEIEFEYKKQSIEQTQQSPQKSGKKSAILPTLELRCLRLKDYNDPVANFINLFPDACSIMVNNRLIKQFQPLHKQSSLKYRRDQCVKFPANLLNFGINKVVITERILKKQVKTDERIQPENHLVAIFAIQNIQLPRQENKLQKFLSKSGYLNLNNTASVQRFLSQMNSRRSSFQYSEDLLKQSMFITSKKEGEMQEQEQEIGCDNIKVPLICSLTLQKMKYPGRSIFCKHFACFDVYNFILLNAQAKIPKWQCPICKSSSYKFEIDSIMLQIITQLQKQAQKKKQIKQDEQLYEVEFNRNMDIKFINSKGKYIIDKKSKIIEKFMKSGQNGLSGQSGENGENRQIQQNFIQSDLIPGWINNIYDLPIEGKNKRERLGRGCGEEQGGDRRNIGCFKLEDNEVKPDNKLVQLLSGQKQLQNIQQPNQTKSTSKQILIYDIPEISQHNHEQIPIKSQILDFTVQIEKFTQPIQAQTQKIKYNYQTTNNNKTDKTDGLMVQQNYTNSKFNEDVEDQHKNNHNKQKQNQRITANKSNDNGRDQGQRTWMQQSSVLDNGHVVDNVGVGNKQGNGDGCDNEEWVQFQRALQEYQQRKHKGPHNTSMGKPKITNPVQIFQQPQQPEQERPSHPQYHYNVLDQQQENNIHKINQQQLDSLVDQKQKFNQQNHENIQFVSFQHQQLQSDKLLAQKQVGREQKGLTSVQDGNFGQKQQYETTLQKNPVQNTKTKQKQRPSQFQVDDLFQNYAPRQSQSSYEKKKLPKQLNTSKNSCTGGNNQFNQVINDQAYVNKKSLNTLAGFGVREKLKRTAKEKSRNKKEFHIPENADVIQLSD